MESRKMVPKIYLQGSNGETDMENRFMDMGRGEMGGEDLRYEDVADIHNGILHIQKMDQIVPFSET